MINTKSWAIVALTVIVTAFCAVPAWAVDMGPFGTGLPDSGVTNVSAFPRLFGLLIATQTYFNQHLTDSILALRHDSAAGWSLLALSFLYGVVHAVGPGHGKAVVSSYILANRQTLRNGITLAFLASLAQAAGAVLLILIASLFLHLTSVSITRVTYRFEIGSDALVVLLGGWLVWKKIVSPLLFPPRSLPPTKRAGQFQALEAYDGPPPLRSRAAAWRQRIFARGAADCDCGGLHIPSSSAATGALDLKKAWSVIASTALRPCTGALIVLVFAISQGFLLMGIAATFVMGLGTAMTVATLAMMTAGTRGSAVRLVGVDRPMATRIKTGFEVMASLAVLSAGLLMLTANLSMR